MIVDLLEMKIMWGVFPFLYSPDEEPPQKPHLTAHIYVSARMCATTLSSGTASDGNEASAGPSFPPHRLELLCDWGKHRLLWHHVEEVFILVCGAGIWFSIGDSASDNLVEYRGVGKRGRQSSRKERGATMQQDRACVWNCLNPCVVWIRLGEESGKEREVLKPV